MLKFALQYDSVSRFVREFPEKVAVSGVYVKTDKPVEVGDPIGLLFRFKAEQSSFTATGEVVWIDTDEEAKSGKKGLVVRNIKLDAESQRVFNAHMRQQVTVAEAPPEEAVVMSPQAPPPPPPSQPQHAPQQAHQPPAHPPQAPSASAAVAGASAEPKKKWPLITAIILVLAIAGFSTWYFALGGSEILANLGIEYRDGKVTSVDPVSNSFKMGLIDQVSSDWLVVATAETQWIGVRGVNELRPNDRIGLRYRQADGKYEAVQVTVKERVIAGTIGSLIDKTKGIFSLQNSKLAGSMVELSTEFNDQVRGLAENLKPGDVVETVYAVGAGGKNMVRKLVVRERTAEGEVTTVDPAAKSLSLKTVDGESLALTARGDVEFTGVDGWSAVGEQDGVKVTFQPDDRALLSVEMVKKYVAPKAAPKKVAPPPRVMSDVNYSTDDVVGRFKFNFNRRPNYSGPNQIPGAYARVIVSVPGSTSSYPKSEIFLSEGPIRTVRFTEDRGDLMLTFLADKGVSPRCTFEVQGSSIVALCFKN